MSSVTSKTLRFAALAVVLAALGAAGLSGCSTKVSGTLIPNQPPTVELTNAPVSADVSNPYFYAYRVNWSGNDPDGRVDHYEYAIDPPAVVVRDTSKCNDGDTCGQDADCTSDYCGTDTKCVEPPPDAHMDGRRNAGESGEDGS